MGLLSVDRTFLSLLYVNLVATASTGLGGAFRAPHASAFDEKARRCEIVDVLDEKARRYEIVDELIENAHRCGILVPLLIRSLHFGTNRLCSAKEAALQCPRCHSDCRVFETRTTKAIPPVFAGVVDDSLLWRRRKCKNPRCGHRWTTYEIGALELRALLTDVARLTLAGAKEAQW